jgi:Leucine-rich repeat (LRR) protein
LQKLYLDHNCIKEIEIGLFENLPNLEELHLSDNAIRTVQHLWHLTSLKTLNLSLNYIKSDRQGSFQVTKELAALNMLEDLSLSENPVSIILLCVVFPSFNF